MTASHELTGFLFEILNFYIESVQKKSIHKHGLVTCDSWKRGACTRDRRPAMIINAKGHLNRSKHRDYKQTPWASFNDAELGIGLRSQLTWNSQVVQVLLFKIKCGVIFNNCPLLQNSTGVIGVLICPGATHSASLCGNRRSLLGWPQWGLPPYQQGLCQFSWKGSSECMLWTRCAS